MDEFMDGNNNMTPTRLPAVIVTSPSPRPSPSPRKRWTMSKHPVSFKEDKSEKKETKETKETKEDKKDKSENKGTGGSRHEGVTPPPPQTPSPKTPRRVIAAPPSPRINFSGSKNKMPIKRVS